ncbi:MAG: Co2+/Mg2+ efflux protein ApaG [Bacteroidota bacterium]
MNAKITTGVKVSVTSNFLEKIVDGSIEFQVFVYTITIENYNDYPIKLLRRHWYIFDSLAGKSEVEGPGVVGEYPVLLTKGTVQYTSACQLYSDLGTMHGYYVFENLNTNETFKVDIPKFELSNLSKKN